jgi:hypothetical protein
MGATWMEPNEDRTHRGLVESLACIHQLMRNAVLWSVVTYSVILGCQDSGRELKAKRLGLLFVNCK